MPYAEPCAPFDSNISHVLPRFRTEVVYKNEYSKATIKNYLLNLTRRSASITFAAWQGSPHTLNAYLFSIAAMDLAIRVARQQQCIILHLLCGGFICEARAPILEPKDI